jgi:hypothetical protein
MSRHDLNIKQIYIFLDAILPCPIHCWGTRGYDDRPGDFKVMEGKTDLFFGHIGEKYFPLGNREGDYMHPGNICPPA